MSVTVRVASAFLLLLATAPLANAQDANVRTFATTPFDNITGDSNDEWIGTGIITSLETQIKNAQKLVLEDTDASERNSPDLTTPSEHHTKPIAAFFSLARQQNIDLLLTGSYQRVGDQ